MSKQEIFSWLRLLVLLAACAWLGWVLHAAWPDTATFSAKYETLTRPVLWAVAVIIVAMSVLRGWRPREPLSDERDHAIAHAAGFNGLVALSLLLTVLGVMVMGDGLALATIDGNWARYFLLWLVGLAWTVEAGYRVVGYRRG